MILNGVLAFLMLMTGAPGSKKVPVAPASANPQLTLHVVAAVAFASCGGGSFSSSSSVSLAVWIVSSSFLVY